MLIKSFMVTLLGVGIAGGSAFVAKDVLQTNSSASQSTIEMVEVMVARTNIDFGQPIEAHMISAQSWPKDAVPAGAFTDMALLLPTNNGQPRRAIGQLFQGEILLNAKVSNFGERVTIVQKLGENTRAIAIEVDAATAVGGFVSPGDFVDILLTQGSGAEMQAVTVLQNIRVIGIDQQSEENSNDPVVARTITVEVTPVQGQRLALAQKAGTLSLTLRTLDGVIDEPLDRIKLSDLFAAESPVPEDVRVPTIIVRRAGVAQIVELK